MTTKTWSFHSTSQLYCAIRKRQTERECVGLTEAIKRQLFTAWWTSFLPAISHEITVLQKVTYLIMAGNCAECVGENWLYLS